MEDLKFDDSTIVLFTNMVRGIIQKEMRSYIQSQNIETFVDLSVTKVASDGLSATLIDLVTGEIYSDIPNYTGVKLNEKDIVRVYKGGGKTYIGQTFGSRKIYLCNNKGKDDTK